MLNKLSNKELVAAGHKFAANLDADTPLIDRAKMVSELATRLDVALVAAAEAGKQRDALVAESTARGEIVERLIGQYSAAGYHAVQNSLNPGQSLLYDAMQMMKSTNTDAMLNAVRAEGVEMLANAIGSPYAESDRQDYEAGFNRAIEVVKTHSAPKLAAQLRAAAAKDGV